MSSTAIRAQKTFEFSRNLLKGRFHQEENHSKILSIPTIPFQVFQLQLVVCLILKNTFSSWLINKHIVITHSWNQRFCHKNYVDVPTSVNLWLHNISFYHGIMSPLKLEDLLALQGLLIKDQHITSQSLNYLEFDIPYQIYLMHIKFDVTEITIERLILLCLKI